MGTKQYVRSDSGKRYEVKDGGTLERAPEHTGGALGRLGDAAINVVKTGAESLQPSSRASSPPSGNKR